MELQITGKNIELTPELNQYIERKLGKLDRHLPNIIESKVEIAEEKTKSRTQRFIAQVTINSSGTLLRGEERGNDFFTAIDRVASIMDRQIERFKGKRYARKGNTSLARAGATTEEPVNMEAPHSIVKTKKFPVNLMSVDEASEQMELLGHDFFLYLNRDDGKLNLLYRRKDKDYGIIEPIF
jgi:putative sigma-54 modulation protein